MGATWVAAAAVSRRHVACVAPWRAPGAQRVPVTFQDIQDPVTGAPPTAPLRSLSAADNALTFETRAAPHRIEVMPSAAPVEGGTRITLFGPLGAAPAAASASFACADDYARLGHGGKWLGTLGTDPLVGAASSAAAALSSSFACSSAPRPAGFVAVPQAADASTLSDHLSQAGPARIRSNCPSTHSPTLVSH